MEGAAGVWLHPQSTKGTQGPREPPPPPRLGAIYTHGPFITPSQGEDTGGGDTEMGGGGEPGTPDKSCPPFRPHPAPHLPPLQPLSTA